MPEGQNFPERLWALRQSGLEALAPLWIEHMPPEDALTELGKRQGNVFRLQEAKVLLDLGRNGESAQILLNLAPLPSGLSSIREALRTRVESETPERETAATLLGTQFETSEAPEEGTLTAIRPGSEASLEDALAAWLSRVRGWRRTLSV